MKIAELLDENIFARGISAIKSIGSKAVPAVAKTSDDAVRAAQDAKMNALGRVGAGLSSFKSGDKVTVDLKGYRNRVSGFDAAKHPIFKNDTTVAKVISVTPSTSNSERLLATLETIPGKVTKMPEYYKGQIVGWKEVPTEVQRFAVPLEYLSKAN